MIPQIAEGLGDLMTSTALHAIDSGMKKYLGDQSSRLRNVLNSQRGQ